MDPIDELFMFLCRLKCVFLAEDLAVRFKIHISSVSRKIITWTNHLYFLLGGITIWPSRENILEHMPQDFRILYPNTRVIIDCTEIFTEKLSSLALTSRTFSSYNILNMTIYMIFKYGEILSHLVDLIDFWCLLPLSVIFQLYHGDQF